MKILLAGHISYNLMSQFYRNLKNEFPRDTIAVYGLIHTGRNLFKEEIEEFDLVIDEPLISRKSIRKYVFTGRWINVISRKDITNLITNLVRFRLKSAYGLLCGVSYNELLRIEKRLILNGFDIINVHFLNKQNLELVELCHNSQKLVLSFWGSDLYRLNDAETIEFQNKSFHKANYITLHNEQMKSHFINKFGSTHVGKIKMTLFGCDENRFNLIDKHLTNKKSQLELKKNYGIKESKLMIQVGYSGGMEHQHIEVIRHIEKLSNDVKSKICLIIPTTYNNYNVDYYEQLKDTIAKADVQIVHITDFLTVNEMLKLTAAMDIFIHVRISDALNNSMIEHLYSGTTLITGNWLNYEILTENDIFYNSISSVNELSGLISKFINQYHPKKDNKAKIRTLFGMSNQIKKWAQIYNELDGH